MINRKLYTRIESKLFKGKVIIITGARQVGKTTLLKELMNRRPESSLYINCDEPDWRSLLSNVTSSRLRSLMGNKKLILIDEAQRVENIGITLKLFADELKEFQAVASGSSAIEISDNIYEPLTGRRYDFKLYPLLWSELIEEAGIIEANRNLTERIVFGMYPEIYTNQLESKELLKSIAESYLFKDILKYNDIRKPELLEKLVRALAFQIGSEVSFNELSKTLRTDNETISSYVDLLEKSFVVFKLSPFSRNLRSEITKKNKIYFFDTGIRNALINDFKPFEVRQDKGALWENFLISEKVKLSLTYGKSVNHFFWRTYQQQEVDFIEADEDKVRAFEIGWNAANKKIPKTFAQAYPEAETYIIDSKNFNDFLVE